MAYIAFALGIAFFGGIASLLDIDTNPSQSDYHYVPFAGDAFGA